MKFIPYPYQEHAINWIIDKPSSALFLDMGLGKTIITLTAIGQLMHSGKVNKVLVIAPKRVAQTTWPQEVKKWDHVRHLKLAKILGSTKERNLSLGQEADIWVINRENIHWLTERYRKNWPFDMVVIDELSSFKSHRSQRFKAMKKVRPKIKRMVGLTGTPMPNGYHDLWSQIYLLDQGKRLGKNITTYRENFLVSDKKNQHSILKYKVNPWMENMINRLISDICISMEAKDWIPLPDKIMRTIPVYLPSKAQNDIKTLEKDLLLPYTEVDDLERILTQPTQDNEDEEMGDVVADTAAVLSNKLLQMANGAVYDEDHHVRPIHNAKLEALTDIVEETYGEPLLVYYTFKHDAKRIREWFPEARILKTEQDIKDWNHGKISMLLAHPASAGHGLNLQFGGHIIIWYGLPWSMELYQQANARLYRHGQDKSVLIHHLIAQGTLDDDVYDSLQDKTANQNALLQSVKARIRRMKRGKTKA